jgi:MFS family permease
MTIGFLAMAFASMVWGNLSDRFGPRPVVLTGMRDALLVVSLALASQAHLAGSVFQLLFGVLVGAATRRDVRADDGLPSPAGSIRIAASPSRWCRPAWAWRR